MRFLFLADFPVSLNCQMQFQFFSHILFTLDFLGKFDQKNICFEVMLFPHRRPGHSLQLICPESPSNAI